MTERPSGTVSLVTRASSGIGAATTGALAAQDAAVALVAAEDGPRRVAVNEILVRPTEQEN